MHPRRLLRPDSNQLSAVTTNPTLAYCSTILYVELLPSAGRHGVTEAEVGHAIEHLLAVEDAGDEPDRWLVIGPDHAGNMLEIILILTEEGEQLIIHAMPMRTQYRRLLP